MKKILQLIILAAFPCICFAQSKRLAVGRHTLLLREYTVKSEEEGGPGAHDIVLKIYREEKGKPKYLYQHYLYKNEGGDCNNLFWAMGTYNISGDTIRFTTHHCQKTGLDPIIEWEQETYTINSRGELVPVARLYKKQGAESWTTEPD